MSAGSWPPPVGARITVSILCCGRGSETTFKWDGQEREFITEPCPYARNGHHQPTISATWTVPTGATS